MAEVVLTWAGVAVGWWAARLAVNARVAAERAADDAFDSAALARQAEREADADAQLGPREFVPHADPLLDGAGWVELPGFDLGGEA